MTTFSFFGLFADGQGKRVRTVVNPDGTHDQIGRSGPYPYTPVGPGQYGLALGSVASLTIPTGAIYATVQAIGANVYYTTDGQTEPTTTSGVLIYPGQSAILSGSVMLSNFQAISSGGTVNIEYFA